MRVLVSGAGGFLGRQAVTQLLRRNHEVRAIIRPASTVPKWSAHVEIFPADLRNTDELVSAFDGIDAVLHLAAATSGNEDAQFASTVVATERFLNAMAKSDVKRLVHVSSLVVYDWARANGTMNENTPLLKDPYAMGAYTIAKVWQERVVMRHASARSWDLTIMRPGFIWGYQHAQIAGMGRRVGRAYLMIGPFTRLPLSHVANCADCLVAAIERPTALGETFNVIDGDDIRVWRYVREYAKRMAQRGFLVPVPYRFGLGLAYLALLVSRTLFGKAGQLPSLLTPRRFESQFKPIRFSDRKLKEKLGWVPPLAFDECLNETYKKITFAVALFIKNSFRFDVNDARAARNFTIGRNEKRRPREFRSLNETNCVSAAPLPRDNRHVYKARNSQSANGRHGYSDSLGMKPNEHETTPSILAQWAPDTYFILPKSSLSILRTTFTVLWWSRCQFFATLYLALLTSRPGILGLAYQLFYFLEAVLAAQELRQSKARHVHNHIGDQSGTVTMLAARLAGIGYSITFHGWPVFFDAKYSRIKEKVLAARFTRAISYFCQSQLMMFSECDDPGFYSKSSIAD